MSALVRSGNQREPPRKRRTEGTEARRLSTAFLPQGAAEGAASGRAMRTGWKPTASAATK